MKCIKFFNVTVIIMIFLIYCPGKLMAQDEIPPPGMAPGFPVPGYVMLGNGDTLFGEIVWRLKYVENNPVEIKFIAEDGGSTIYNASEVRGFGNRIITWEDDNPVPIENIQEDYVVLPSYKKGIPVFMNRIIYGAITVSQNRSSGGITTTKVAEDSRIDGISFEYVPGEELSIGLSYSVDHRVLESKTRFLSYFVRKSGGPIIKIEKDNYEENFATLFGDCPIIKEELTKNPDLGKFKNFMILAEIYNYECGR